MYSCFPSLSNKSNIFHLFVRGDENRWRERRREGQKREREMQKGDRDEDEVIQRGKRKEARGRREESEEGKIVNCVQSYIR